MIGGNNRENRAADAVEEKDTRLPYQSPAIVYEGQIDIRAGSPIPDPPFGDPALDLTTDR